MLKGFATLENGKIKFEPDLEHKIAEYKERGRCEVIIVPYDKPHHWLHEFYRGYVIPDICNHIGDSDEYTMHWFFKTKFLTVEVKDLKMIPGKRMKDARIVRRTRDAVDYATGQIISTEEYYQVTFSTGAITGKEFREYIQKVENFFMEFLGGAYSKRTEKEGMQYRDEGFKDE